MKLIGLSLATYSSTVALALAFDAAGIPFCVDGIDQLRGAPVAHCRGFDHALTVTVFTSSRPDTKPVGSRVVVAAQPLGSTDLRRHEPLRHDVGRVVKHNATSDRRITLRPESVEQAQSIMSEQSGEGDLSAAFRQLEDDLNAPGGITSTVRGRTESAATVASGVFSSGGRDVASVQVPGLGDRDLIAWARLEQEWAINARSIALTSD